MNPLSLLSSVSAMLAGSPLPGRRAKAPKAPKKYRKESEQERRARQAKRGSK